MFIDRVPQGPAVRPVAGSSNRLLVVTALKDEIWRLDRDLKDPVGAEKRMRKQSEDVTEWLERQVQIPEGSHYSRALELLGFQKEVIAQIYDNPGAVPKCAADPEG